MVIELPKLAPRIVETRLDNGLRLVILPDPASSLVAINLWYHVGSRHDPPGRSGLAHLFEHMLFQGSANVAANEHFQYVQRCGGTTNASTSFDRTNYYETLPSHCLELGLWLESDRLGFLLPALTEEKFEGQRSVVMNERLQRTENQPYGSAFETLLSQLFVDQHPYSWPIIGHMRDIEAAKLADVDRFFRDHYRPDNAVLTLVGDIEPAAAADLVNRYFADLPSPAAAAAANPTGKGVRAAPVIELEDDVALERTYFAWRSPPLTDERRSTGEILATVLTGGKSSPLYQDLVHRSQLAQDVSAFQVPMELESIFMLVATARPGVPLEQIEDRLDVHLRTIGKNGPQSDDLERARNQVVTGVLDELQSVESVADLLSRSTTFYGDPAAIDDEVMSYLQVDEDDLRGFADKILEPGNEVRLRVVPRRVAESASEEAKEDRGVES